MSLSPIDIAPPAGARIRRNVGLDVILAVGSGTTTAVVGVLLPTFARQGGLAPLGVALLSAAPFLGNLLSAFTGRYGPQRTGGFAGLRIAGSVMLVAIALAPHPGVILAAACLFWLSVSFGVPYQTRLWAALYPADVRGRVIGVLGTARSAAAGIAALSVGLLANALGTALAISAAGAVGQPVPSQRSGFAPAFRCRRGTTRLERPCAPSPHGRSSPGSCSRRRSTAAA